MKYDMKNIPVYYIVKADMTEGMGVTVKGSKRSGIITSESPLYLASNIITCFGYYICYKIGIFIYKTN